MDSLLIVYAQQNSLVGDVEKNFQWIKQASLSAKEQYAADLIIFPELSLCGYPPEDLLLRPGFIHWVEEAVERLLKEVNGIAILFGHPVLLQGKLYNAASLISDGEILCQYYKHELPNYSVFDEKRYFEPGSASSTFRLKGIALGITLCEDIWAPEPVRHSVAQGAEIILNLNASPYHKGKLSERYAMVKQRTTENKVPLVYVNQVGGQDELVFDGASFVMSAEGEITQSSPAFTEGLYPVTFQRNDMGDVIPQAGQTAPIADELAEIYNALVMGVRDFVYKNGFKGAVVGLSGGIDSALTLAVAADALGGENVEALLMPSRYTADMSNEDALLQARALNVPYHIISVEPVFQTFLDSLKPALADSPPAQWDTTEENLQARTRGVMLMAVSNRKGKMLLTTGNKSEMSVGYATLYGDMAGGFAVLKDVYKVLVYRLCEYRNSVSQVIPQRVIDRPPSAELKPDQKDSDSLPDYPVLDVILEMYIEQDQCLEQIVAAGYEQELVRRVLKMVDLNEYKRRQAAPGIRITKRAFGRDRRYPITSGFIRRH
ncbi:MAG: NAD+ synthase [Gammaproteobacteria bacterium]|nr:NAD+ synthase [Gammaproteobacteria bacterium]